MNQNPKDDHRFQEMMAMINASIPLVVPHESTKPASSSVVLRGSSNTGGLTREAEAELRAARAWFVNKCMYPYRSTEGTRKDALAMFNEVRNTPAAQAFLSKFPYYFTEIDRKIYSQFSSLARR